jgi:hypothetical protein
MINYQKRRGNQNRLARLGGLRQGQRRARRRRDYPGATISIRVMFVLPWTGRDAGHAAPARHVGVTRTGTDEGARPPAGARGQQRQEQGKSFDDQAI